MSDTYQHYAAPASYEELCNICGHKIRYNEIIIDLPEVGDMAVAHEACAEDAAQGDSE